MPGVLRPAGLLLTGGGSVRMGRDKATLEVEGETFALRAARALRAIAEPVLAIGPEAGTGLHAIDDPREGPLMALLTGGAALRARAHAGPFLVLACDLPNITGEVLEHIASGLADGEVALPVVHGFDQPLAACYAQRAIDVAARAITRGIRSMREFLMALDVKRIDCSAFAHELADVDTPEDLRRILDGPA